jgi:curved DNA-binding protein CbpA
MGRDFYSVLAVPRNVAAEQLRKRFRQLARERHPDRFQGEEKLRAERDFQDITEAFNALSDPDRRRQHDVELARPQEPAATDGRQAAKIYLQRGIKAYREGNFAAAADSFDRAIQSDRENAQAWHHLALACSQNPSLLERAKGAIENACRLSPMNSSYLKLAGRLVAATGDLDAAERYYREALEWGGEDDQISAAIAALEAQRRQTGGKRGLFGRSG